MDKGYLEIFGFSRFSTEEIIEIIDIFKPKRIVFDSLNIFSDIGDFRRSPQWRNIFKEIKDKKITCLAITEKKTGRKASEFDEFDFMGDGIILFDKKLKNELDPYPTSNIQIQKMRLTKVNEMSHSFIIKDHGIELIGKTGLEKKIACNILHANKAKPDFVANIDH
jgi:KaiC/GvpD/RAD55 family RecA-like ATPase